MCGIEETTNSTAFMSGIMNAGHVVEKLKGDTYTDGIVMI
jgi:hypothetical protein